MNILQIKDIEKIYSAILEDNFLKKCLSEKDNIADHTKNILHSEKILEYQLIDCFIPFYTKFFPKETYTYSQFIKEAYPKDFERNDTKEKGSFEAFRKNVSYLYKQYRNAYYVPAFVSFIIDSLIPNQKSNKQAFRNYKYKFFNARSYSYIIRNSSCLPYFCKDMASYPEKLKSFYGLFTETTDYPLIEQIVSQYYIDYYFSIYLFSEIFNFLCHETNQPSMMEYFNSKDDYGFYLECFLLLCTLLQNSSGMYVKHHLFHTFQKIFFDPKLSKWHKLYTSSKRNFIGCFNQCAYELVLYNEFLYPHIQKLYFEQFKALLENNFSDLKDINIYKQLSNIINANITETAHRKRMSVPIKDLAGHSMPSMPEPENRILNYIWNKFYNHVPYNLDSSLPNYIIRSESPYYDLIMYIAPRVDITFRNLEEEYYLKNARFLI